MESLSTVDLFYIIKELKPLIGGKIDKIYQQKRKELIIQIHKTGIGKVIIRVSPNLIYISETKDISKRPTNFCMDLRKFTNNMYIENIELVDFERIIRFSLSNKRKISLILEFFSSGNIIITDENDKIVMIQETQKWKDRTLRGGVIYRYPKRDFNPLNASKEDIEEFLKNSDKESLVKALALAGFGGMYAEEILRDIDKEISPKDADIDKIYNNINELLSRDIDARIIEDKLAIPFAMREFKDKKTTKTESFSKALDILFTRHIEPEKKITKKDKLKIIIQNQQKQIENFKKEYEINTKKGNLIYENYQKIQKMLSENKKGTKIIEL